MHVWGEKNVDWQGIGDAADYIGEFLKRWGRVSVRQTKEKWGRSCVYCDLGWSCLLGITHPGYVHYRPYPEWLKRLDIFCLSKLIRKLNVVVVPFHAWLYRLAYKRAIKKWPHLRAEIVGGAGFQELLEGL
jgi:hypothetical protein